MQTNRQDLEDQLDHWYCRINNIILTFKQVFKDFARPQKMKELIE